MRTKNIKVDILARVEGEGGLYVKVRGNEVEEAKVNIYEPPRFFEAFLVGRHYSEAPDITARICGICPIAYQMSSVRAMEDAFGVVIDPQVRALRRMIYCGEWIESHVLHMYMLHAPDFLGYEDAIQLAKDHPDVVTQGLKLKKIGNEIMEVLGGREIHPINIKVGGFYKVPRKKELQTLKERLQWALDAAQKTVDLVATFKFPDFERDYEYVSLRNEGEYPIFDGRIVSNKGVNVPLNEFEDMFPEEHVAHSTSLHSLRKGGGAYHVGPLARFNLCYDLLTPVAKQAAEKVGLANGCRNPFKSIVVRAIETVFACEEALRVIDNYEMPDQPYADFQAKAGVGFGCSEAPRGICFHSYEIGEDQLIKKAHIMPPTAQNLRTMEEDVTELVPKNLSMSDDDLQWLCEQAIRNYDPCISCSCHYLKLKIDRLPG